MLILLLATIGYAGEGVYLPDASASDQWSGKVAVGGGYAWGRERNPLVLPTGRIEFSPLEALRLEAGYAGLPGRDEGGLATARLQVLSGDTWAVAPWAGVFSIAESPLLPIAGLAFSAGSERLRFDMSIPIYMPIYPAPPVGPGLLATEITLGWTPVEQHTVRLGTTTVAVYRAGYQFQPDSGLMARADAGMGWDGSVVGSMSVGFTW